MSRAGGTRSSQRGTILLGLAGGMLVVAGGFAGAYYVVGTRSVANAATNPPPAVETEPVAGTGKPSGASPAGDGMSTMLAHPVKLETANGTIQTTWAELGVEVDPDEAKRVGAADLNALAAKSALPVRIDRDKAAKALLALKAKTDRAPVDAYLDLERRTIHDDTAGQGLDVYGSIPRIAAASRANAPSLQLATIAMPANVTKASLGIDDISNVMGYWVTKFAVSDRDRNFNLKLAASKLNGIILKPGEEWSFNDTVGERSQKNGYKIAHVINAGEMVDGLAGGTCQISTTLFGASFFAGIDIVKTTNHSRPSAYTPLGFDATVVWPTTDLKMKNPYDFPVAVRYVVANGEARAEILGKKRPWDKVVFVRNIIEQSEDFPKEDRFDDKLADGESSIDQQGFPGFKILRERRFYKGDKLVKTNKWMLEYKPVTEYTRRGTSKDPDAKKAVQQPLHGPQLPGSSGASFSQ